MPPLRNAASVCPRPRRRGAPHTRRRPPESRRRLALAALPPAPTPYENQEEKGRAGGRGGTPAAPSQKQPVPPGTLEWGKGAGAPEEVPREPVRVLGEFGGLRLAERRFTLERRLFAPNPQLGGF